MTNYKEIEALLGELKEAKQLRTRRTRQALCCDFNDTVNWNVAQRLEAESRAKVDELETKLALNLA